MHRKRYSLFVRLIVVFLISVLPIQIGNQLLNNWLYDNIQKNAIAYASARVLDVKTELEDAVEIIRNQMQFMLYNSKVRDFFVFGENLTNTERYDLIKDVNDLLYYLHNINPYLEEIHLCYPESGMEITSSGQYKFMGSDMRDALSSLEKTGSQLYDLEGVLHYSSVVASKGEKHLYLDAKLDMMYITEAMRLSAPNGESIRCIVNHRAKQVYPQQDDISVSEFIILLKNCSEEVSEVTLNGMEYLMIADFSEVLECSFLELLPVRQVFALPILLRQYINLLTALVFVGIAFYSIVIYRGIQFPIRRLVQHFEQATLKNLSHPIDSKSYIYEFWILTESCNQMNERIQKLIHDNFEATIHYQQAELKQLHAQINPHFLYNSFFILRHSISEGNYAHAERMTDYLGKYFEYITDQSHTMIGLQREYDFAVTYLNIQLIRFEGGISAEIEELPVEISCLTVPHLILQPLFENALEHGIVTTDGEGLVRLRFVLEAQNIQIIVEDNGNLLTDAQLEKMQKMLVHPTTEHEQHALVNTHKRLRGIYGETCGLAFNRSQLGGLQVIMTVSRILKENGGGKHDFSCAGGR